jgi:hypothetical protein
MKKLTIFFAFLFFAAIEACSPQQKATALNADQISQAVQSQSYQFLATYVQPSGGRQRNVTGTYTLNVSKTEVVADLPYFGKAYNAQIGSTDGGVKFQSKDFTYSIEAGKKGSQEIKIKPKDVADTQDLFLTIYDNGSATLRVNSVNRQSISYTGEIRALQPAK